MNDLMLNWKKISRGLPSGRRAANDRAPTIEEIQKLVEYPDRRIKPVVYTMASSGIRIGAWLFDVSVERDQAIIWIKTEDKKILKLRDADQPSPTSGAIF